MDPLNFAVILIGLVSLALALVLFRRPAADLWPLKLVWFLAFPLLYQTGFALLLVGTGYRHFDALTNWGWESWFGFGSTALLAMLFAITRFRGASRVVLTLLATGWFLYPYWFYWKA